MGMVRSRWAAVGAAVAVTLGAGGLVSVSADTAESVFVGVDPERVLDTRFAVGLDGPLVNSQPEKLTVTGSISVVDVDGNASTATVVPSGATAIVANVTVVDPTTVGFVSVRPGTATGVPSTSNINITAPGGVLPNSVTVEVAADGTIDLFFFGTASEATTDLLVDIVGYYTEGSGGAPGPQGPAGLDGVKGDTGEQGPTRGITPDQIARQQWYSDQDKTIGLFNGNFPRGLVYDGSFIWVLNAGAGFINPIEPAEGRRIGGLGGFVEPWGIAYDGRHLLFTDLASDTLEIYTAGGILSKVDTTAVGDAPRAVVAASFWVWVVNGGDGTVSKVNPGLWNVDQTIAVGNSPRDIAFDGQHLWVTNFADDTVSVIDPTDDAVVATVDVGDGPYGVAFDGESMWVTHAIGDTVSRIDRDTRSVTATVPIGQGPRHLAFDGRYMWVANQDDDSVSVVDTVTTAVTDTRSVGDGPYEVVFDGANIWVSNLLAHTVSKINVIANRP